MKKRITPTVMAKTITAATYRVDRVSFIITISNRTKKHTTIAAFVLADVPPELSFPESLFPGSGLSWLSGPELASPGGPCRASNH